MSKKEIYEEMGLKIKEHLSEIRTLASARALLKEEFKPPVFFEPVHDEAPFESPFDAPIKDAAKTQSPAPSKNARVKCTDRIDWSDVPDLVRKTPGITPEEIIKIKFPNARGGNKRGFIYKCNMALWAFQNREGIMRSEVRYGKDGRRKHYYPVDRPGVPLQLDFPVHDLRHDKSGYSPLRDFNGRLQPPQLPS
jgi:hypothetical protein